MFCDVLYIPVGTSRETTPAFFFKNSVHESKQTKKFFFLGAQHKTEGSQSSGEQYFLWVEFLRRHFFANHIGTVKYTGFNGAHKLMSENVRFKAPRQHVVLRSGDSMDGRDTTTRKTRWLVSDCVPCAVLAHITSFLDIYTHARICGTCRLLRYVSKLPSSSPSSITVVVPCDRRDVTHMLDVICLWRTPCLRMDVDRECGTQGDVYPHGLVACDWVRVCAMVHLVHLRISLDTHGSPACLSTLRELHLLQNLDVELDRCPCDLDLKALGDVATLETLALRFYRIIAPRKWNVGAAVQPLTRLRSLTVLSTTDWTQTLKSVFDIAVDAPYLPPSLTSLELYRPDIRCATVREDWDADDGAAVRAGWDALFRLPLVYLHTGLVLTGRCSLSKLLAGIPTLRHLTAISAPGCLAPYIPTTALVPVYGLTALVLEVGADSSSMSSFFAALPCLELFDARLSSMTGFDALAGRHAPALTRLRLRCLDLKRFVRQNIPGLCALVAPCLRNLELHLCNPRRLPPNAQEEEVCASLTLFETFANLEQLKLFHIPLPQEAPAALPRLPHLRSLEVVVASWTPRVSFQVTDIRVRCPRLEVLHLQTARSIMSRVYPK
jgi:hypothetical protein